MTLPRLEIDLGKIEYNASNLVARLARSGLSVTGVTKAILGDPEIAHVLLRSGVGGLGDSRVENIEKMRHAGIRSEITLIRTPMLSQIDSVVLHADISFNSELDVIAALSSAAKKVNNTHNVVLMVELGDLREGIMPGDMLKAVDATLRLPNIAFRGIAANLGCLSGISPNLENMAELSMLADSIDSKFGPITHIVSGGNSANIEWALSGADRGRINNLRLGEAILFGREALHRKPIEGLHQDAITLVAEVIEAKIKPSLPRGEIGQDAFGEINLFLDRGPVFRAILAIGRQDIDPAGLRPPPGLKILGTNSDHMVLDSGKNRISVGDEITFQMNYGAFIRAMSSPFVSRDLVGHCTNYGCPLTASQ